MSAYGVRMLAAYQGKEEKLAPEIVENDVAENADGYALHITCWATAVLKNSLGRYSEAVTAAQGIAYELSFAAPHALSELIEGAVRMGDRALADDALQRLLPLTIADSDWARGVEARARALLASNADAEEHYTKSIACFACTPLRTELARAHLVYGEWLRREGRRSDAREQLRTARDMFVGMGTEAFAERAHRELVATGEKVRKRVTATRNDLTPQEEHIARLARDGRTNPEIAVELFVSANTVDYHLRNIYSKLGIHSRRELRGALAQGSRR